MTPAELAAALGGARREGKEWRCLCPAHVDRHPSLSITENNGTLLVTCRTGCSQDVVIAALKLRRLWPNGTDDHSSDYRREVVTYNYRDERGSLRYQVVRYAPKDFRQRRPNGSPNTWLWNMQGVEPLPYRLPEMLGDPDATIYIAEGEKDVDTLVDLGLVASCNHGGAGKWRPEISHWFAGRHVVILPDNDDKGRDHARDVARKLTGIAASIKIVELPGLPPKGDVSDWLAAGGTADELEQLAAAAEAPSNTNTASIDLSLLSGANWLVRDIPEPDFLLGELVSTTCRIELIGPTGLGKTNLLVALGVAVADGSDFLHWRGSGSPKRVLCIDGEMSRRLTKKRLVDAARRHGRMPDTFHYLNREDFPAFEPLNTETGQRFVDVIIDALGGVDLLLLDNVQSLLLGDMKDEEPWQHTLPWVRSLTSRNIGQIWAHHTGHDESRGYGSKTREWQLDSVILMEAVERSEADVAFSIKFTKARERSPDNRADFDQALITLTNDTWTSERGERVRTKRAAKDRALELLQDAITREGVIPPASEHIPPNMLCVTEGTWRRYCELGSISEGSPDATRMAFKRAADKLIKSGDVEKWQLWVWAIR